MPAAFQISNRDVAFAESVLLPSGAQFDDERRRFIKNLNTIDLQAVPGSGKTTALLAKLIALDRHLPQSGRSAILVISHTNAAVNEIRHRIGAVCPVLFGYPHFVGTIQSFVDKFLAIPSFVNAFGFRPSRIDADAYNLEISRRYQNLQKGVKNWIDHKSSAGPEEFVQNLRFDSELNLTAGLDGSIVLKSKSNSPTYKTLAGIKKAILKNGLLHFEDVFLFAEFLLQRDSLPRRLLQKRFKYVFVDEMQDMAPHQHRILEALFGQDVGVDTTFQRIGDTDQAIFGGTNIVDAEGWHPRTETLTLANSLRLSQPIASILSPFAFERDDDFEIIGLNDSSILPHLLIYDDDSIGFVTRRYAQLIEQFQLDGSIPQKAKGKFTAIAWNSVWTDVPGRDERKLRLVDFCPTFRRAALRKQEEFETLADYIFNIDPDDRTLCSARKGIVRGVCRALMLAEVVDPRSERHFTPRSLASYLRYEVATEIYQRINRILLRLSVDLVAGRTGVTNRRLRLFVPMLVENFDRNCDSNNTCSFLTGTQTADSHASAEYASDPNLLRFGDVEINLGTVHSVKGQTHMATLYIESSYFNDGGKKYESQRLAPQFKGVKLRANAGKRVRESAKMVYVGFSRPTHLLVFAVHKERYESYLFDIDTTRWKLIKLFEERGDT